MRNEGEGNARFDCGLVHQSFAVDAAEGAWFFLHRTERLWQLLFDGGDAARIAAVQVVVYDLWLMALGSRQLLVKRCRDAVKQFEDERHTDDFTTEHLGKVSSARVVVHSDRDFVDARQRMQDCLLYTSPSPRD